MKKGLTSSTVRVGAGRGFIGEVTVPGDKSISHRAVMLGAVAEGFTRITNFLSGLDCLSTVACFRALGVEIHCDEAKDGLVTVRGRGREGFAEPGNVLDCGNSGTTMRLMLGVLSGYDGFAVLTGDDSLRSRPMGRVTGPLQKMGARIDGRRGGSLAPLAVRGGGLRGEEFTLPVASAQVKSAILLAGLAATGDTVVTEPVRSRDHTERILGHFGIPVRIDGLTVGVSGPARLTGCEVIVPGDISAAAFFLVAGTILPDCRITIRGLGVNPTRVGIIEVLRAMGARIRLFNERESAGEPVADVEVESSELKGISIGGEMIPRLIDEVPVLAVAAAVAGGTTEIRDADELRVKESDRVAVVAAELARMGARVEELPDGLRIEGGRPLAGNSCRTYGDHRLGMSMAVAGLVAEGETVIEDADCVDVSFPHFWEEVAKFGSVLIVNA